MISAVLFISFFIFLILGVPIAICLGLSSVCAILYSGTSLTIVATNMYAGISKFLLLAIPFFVLSGNIMAKAGISKRLIDFVDTCVGHKKGGIAIVCVIVACFFGAISGSGPATVAALGAVLIPAMVEQGGFSAPFSTALMATSSSIAIVIPPSIAFVVYASITGVSIADTERVQDLDENAYLTGMDLDVDRLVYLEVLMSWPLKVLCREDCKGICSRCGKNLNKGSCGCAEEPKDPRMAAISDIFSKFKEV